MMTNMNIVSSAYKRKTCRGERNASSGQEWNCLLPFAGHALVNHHHDRAEIADCEKYEMKENTRLDVVQNAAR